MVVSSCGGIKVHIYLRFEHSFRESFVTANVFPWSWTACGEENLSTLLEEILRVGFCAVSREIVVNVENHHLIIICFKL